jgi:hypothetical protein
VIGRAGASTIAELTAAGRPAILVPFAAATDDHQTANAREMTRAGGARTIKQDEFTPKPSRADRGDRARPAGARQCGGAIAFGREAARGARPRRSRRARRRRPLSGRGRPGAGAAQGRGLCRTGSARMKALGTDIGTIHFVGIGGIGMSGIAEVMHQLGYSVQGPTFPKAMSSKSCARQESR